MIKNIVTLVFSCCCIYNIQAQDTATKKERLDFARMYLEAGGSFFPSFTGKELINDELLPIDYSATLNPYITWGGFHFWGHTEFYVSFPVNQINLDGKEAKHALKHSVATGARIYPWALKKGKLRPYLGFNWGALTFQQISQQEEIHTVVSKDFLLNFDGGILYNQQKFAFRLAVNYFPNTNWQYPISKTETTEIRTPSYSIQLGMLYSFDSTKNNSKKNIEQWNNYPSISTLSYDAKTFGDLFIGAGPSQSFSLSNSEYNAKEFPYLNQKLSSSTYIDFSLGYHFNKLNLFTALSFRNPKFQTEGLDTKQTFHKTSLAFEFNKFLTDYSGFAPYLGLNIAYDHIEYHENVNETELDLTFSSFEPGVTFGWDIVPGKTNEALILRTNLRWYPYANFNIDGTSFNFSQLEYNLIQVVFYPDRLRKNK